MPQIAKNMPPLAKFEIIVVDDWSGDGTEKEIAALSKKYPIKFIQRKGKGGLASAVIAGIKAARGEVFAVMDADLQHPASVLPALFHAIQHSDLAVGSRFSKGGSVSEFSLSRKFVSFGAAALASLLVGSKTTDSMSGFFAAKKSKINASLLHGTGYKVLLEILATHPHLAVADVPYSFGVRMQGVTKLGMGEFLNYIKLWLSLAAGKLLKKW